MSLTAIVENSIIEDPDPNMSPCGECREGDINVARWAVSYVGGSIGGEPEARRDYTCDSCLPLLVRYARHLNDKYHGFTPVEVSELTLPAWVGAA
jgi:hypothetical protein